MKIRMPALSLNYKILLIAIVPLLLVAYFSVNNVLEKSKILEDVENLQELSQLSIRISAYVHEMQKERGATGVFMGSEGLEFASELAEQRALTNTKRDDLDEFLKNFKIFNSDEEFQRTFDIAFDKYAQLDKHRSDVDDQTISDEEGIGFYTVHNALMLDVIHLISKTSSNAEIARIISAYVSYLEGKEQAGVERAVMSNTFAADVFATGIFDYFSSLVTAQDTYFDSFLWYASEEQISYFNQKLANPVVKEVQRMRDIAFERQNEESLGGVDAGFWFRSMTSKIDLMKNVEDKISEDLNTKATELKDAARRDEIFSILLAVGSLILTLLFSVFLGRSITKPLNKLTKGAELIGKGNLDYKTNIKTTDEIGQLSKVFDQMTSELKKSQTKLKEYSVGLEKEVEKRTQQLDVKLKESENSRLATLNILEDITEAKEELKKSYEELKGLDKLKTHFLNITSHELRTPVTPIKIQIGLLLESYFGKITEKQKKEFDYDIKEYKAS